LKNIQDFEQRNFSNFDSEENKDGHNNLKYNIHKRSNSKNSHTNYKINPNMKYMPDHLATKLVDEILNSKFS